MRLVYFILFFTLKYTLRVFYPRQKTVNSPKEFGGRTIYVSNHAASFMDPLVVASMRNPIVFFMTRSDVFTPISKPLLWASHMLPIYRQQDGEDTKAKNEEVFQKCSRILSFGRNLLIFGEGFTDDTFVRRLKPLKKGAVRIGFKTLENINWKKKIYVAGVGCNYSKPNKMRSDLLVSTSDKICLNDYREEYEENPNKVITDLTKKVETLMQEQITHVEKMENTSLHENIMILSRRGMNADSFDRKLSLLDRWNYSRALAKWINQEDVESNEKLTQFKKDAERYFSLLKRFKLEERLLFWKINNPKTSRVKEVLTMIALTPFAIIGTLHLGLPYIIVKRFVEKSFRRKVFHGSVKLIVGKVAMGFLNIPFIFLFHAYIYPSWWLAILYYFMIGIFGLCAYVWMLNFKDFKVKGVVAKMDTSKLAKKRSELVEKLKAAIPEEFHP
ncbi:MAG: 1-acyl-sn-glycerol-3-phosphate acyltransferase [Crocinitomicaceae bacterium]|nr:1-acyl-sn-glycerol-3-phosphate acyltransferase [Crocinitomicaceae bacterium]